MSIEWRSDLSARELNPKRTANKEAGRPCGGSEPQADMTNSREHARRGIGQR